MEEGNKRKVKKKTEERRIKRCIGCSVENVPGVRKR